MAGHGNARLGERVAQAALFIYTLRMKVLVILLALASAAFSQNMATSTDLTDGTFCGGMKFTSPAIVIGSVIKREFDADELRLKGVVMREKDDQRVYLHFDLAFLAGYTPTLMDNISGVLVLGTRVKIKADQCNQAFVVRRITVLKH